MTVAFFTPEVAGKIEELKRVNRVFLCTNSNDRIKSNKIEVLLDLPIATYDHKKPSSKILKKLGIRRGGRNLLVIGDKISVDGLFAWNIGSEFIKVERKISGTESLIVK